MYAFTSNSMDIYDVITLVVIVTIFKYTLDLNFPTTMVILMILCYDFLSVDPLSSTDSSDDVR